jgi:DNA-binding PucR family transcriptional regulator
VERVLLTRCHAATVVNRGTEVVAVVAVDDPSPRPLAQAAALCKTTVEARFPGTVVCTGIGNPYTGAARISTSYAEARHAVDTTTLMSGLGGVVTFAELGISRLLARVRDVADLHEFARDVLGDLIEHERAHGSDYLATLTVYFNENNSPQRSARRLHTHPNTVAYRVRRIEEITGLSLSSYSDRLMLQVALEIVNGLGEPA